MMKETLFNLIRKHHYNISIYTEEIFERRCQEEIIRSDEEQNSFVYVEFDFNTISKALQDEETITKFWDVFFMALSKNNRGSDIIGFLEQESGIGMLLLDSKLPGWERVKGRIEQTSREQGYRAFTPILNNIIKPIVYPACIQQK
ncbi:MAG: hypothetical protein II121_02755 [Fibrobacter sp.]|jgi:hypothetical protein|uniref:hypothetical protein n=1 Tax=uncultured Fibrobacter sp. TaxID=261512 RepID=UPI0015666964|nr:hypothetical protein [uncultured Fibrobacter sp.]MBQ1824042.1 hypothetical protein [Fibrobacter sp.]